MNVVYLSGLRRVVCAILQILVVAALAGQSSASIPYRSYTYDSYQSPVPSPPAYVPDLIVTGSGLGVGDFKAPSDIFVCPDGCIYLVDTGNNRLVQIDPSLKSARIVDRFDNNGQVDTFNGPRGVFVGSAGEVFVADTGNSRIVELDRDGKLVREIGPPEPNIAGILPERFSFRPVRLVVDQARRIFVINANTYDGIMVFDAAGEFRGFVGAPRVTPSVADVIWGRLATREQRERQILFLPVEYNNLDVYDGGFVYATVGGPAAWNSVKKLNPAGKDVLVRNGVHEIRGDLNVDFAYQSEFADVAVRPYGIYSVLDRKNRRVFTYDSLGNLLYVFGTDGVQDGQFTTVDAIDSLGDRILVLDASANRVTVFTPTQYASLIHAAIAAFRHGQFDLASDLWREVLKLNANYDLAYSGIGRNLLMKGAFAEAMRYFRYGNDRKYYSKAFSYYREEVVRDNLPRFAPALIIVLILGYVVRRSKAVQRAGSSVGALYRQLRPANGVSARRQDSRSALGITASTRFIYRLLVVQIGQLVQELKYALYLVVHPYDGFRSLKYERRGHISGATAILLAIVLTYIVARQYTGFIFNRSDLSKLNIYLELFRVVVPFGLWCVVNWAVTTIMDGNGTLRDVYVASAYSFTPIVLLNIPAVALSNAITSEESAFFYLPVAMAVVWSLFLLTVGTMVVHEYDFGKTVVTSLASVAGMGVVIFLSILFMMLSNQVYAFLHSIFSEIAFRS
jgi:DNA-binding beta-propeller fold protein YncE